MRNYNSFRSEGRISFADLVSDNQSLQTWLESEAALHEIVRPYSYVSEGEDVASVPNSITEEIRSNFAAIVKGGSMENNEFIARFARSLAQEQAVQEIEEGVLATDLQYLERVYGAIVAEMSSGLNEFERKLYLSNQEQVKTVKVHATTYKIKDIDGEEIEVTEWKNSIMAVTKEDIEGKKHVDITDDSWVAKATVYGYYSHYDGEEGFNSINNTFSGLIADRMSGARRIGNDEVTKVQMEEEINFGRAAEYNMSWYDMAESHINDMSASGDLVYEDVELVEYRKRERSEMLYNAAMVWVNLNNAKTHGDLFNAANGILWPADAKSLKNSPYVKLTNITSVEKFWLIAANGISKGERTKMKDFYHKNAETYKDSKASMIEAGNALLAKITSEMDDPRISLTDAVKKILATKEDAQAVLSAARAGNRMSMDMYKLVANIAGIQKKASTSNLQFNLEGAEIKKLLTTFNAMWEAKKLQEMSKEDLQKRLFLAKQNPAWYITDKSAYWAAVKLAA